MVKEAKGIYSMIPIVVQVSVSPTLLEETPKYVQSSSETAYYVNTSLLDIPNVWCALPPSLSALSLALS